MPKFFELHFNPQRGDSSDLIFNSFCYAPENIYEKRLGSLFIVGELQNALPQNLKFLDNLAAEIKKRYYSAPVKFSPESALKDCLKKTNEFLESVAKQGEVSWLGNLNVVVFSLAPEKKNNFEVNFTKVGSVKILLIRPGQIIDIGKNLEYSEIEPYPLKIFGNIVSGKLAENDVIIVLTGSIFEHFSELEILEEMPKMVYQDFETLLKATLKNKEKELRKISGVCLLCLLSKESWAEQKKQETTFTFQKEAEKFSLKEVFLPRVNLLTSAYKKIPSLKRLRPNFTYLTGKKNLILVLLFLFLLLLGFLIFK